MLLEFVDVLARKERAQKLNAQVGAPGSRVSVTDQRTDIQGAKKEEEETVKYEAEKIFE